MHDHQTLILTALLIFVFGLVSKASERWTFTGPMFFMLIGILASPLGFGWLDVHPSTDMIKLVAEITLMLILFVDASLIRLDVLLHAPSRIPVRLLGVGLPLTMVLGTVLGAIVFDSWSLWAVALMALVLSPTDAALGQAVIKSHVVPERIRQSVSVESGLNDGIALPPILVCIAALGGGSGEHEGAWLGFIAKQLILGPVVGALVGWLGGHLIEFVSRRDWMEPTFQRLSSLSLAILAFALAESVEGNGFIATFCAGLALGARTPEIRERIQEYGEAEGAQLSLFVFLVFGLVMIPFCVQYWDSRAGLYAILSLTVIRMAPVAISLIGARLEWPTISFIGWFGPRGIASVLYLLIVVDALGVKGFEPMLSVIVLTVALSVVLHGVSATPLSNQYGRWTEKNSGV
jgi:NhaP-type Na+/H+ or K+/H+ antiporter